MSTGGPLRGRHVAAPLVVAALTVPTAYAQGVDAHGLTPSTPVADVAAPLVAPSAALDGKGQGSLMFLGEYGASTLVERVQIDAGSVEETALVGGVFAANLGARWGVSDRLSLGFSAPLYLAATGEEAGGGPALGDALVWVPVGIVLPRADGTGTSLSLSLYADLPTGASGRFLGDQRATGGVMALLGHRAGRVRFDGAFGFEGRGWGEYLNLEGGPSVRSAASLGWMARDDLALHVELTGRASGASTDDAAANLPTDLASPFELLLTARGGAEDRRLWWAAGAGRGVTGGVGAAAIRMFGGVGVRLGALSQDAPVAIEPVTVVVMDSAGRPIAGATALSGEEVIGRTDANGRFVADLPPGAVLRVVAPGFVEGSLASWDPAGGALIVTLDFSPTPVALDVRDLEGAPVDATVTVDGADVEVQRTAEGLALDLPPGEWTLAITAPGLGRQTRTVVVPEGRVAPVGVEVLLGPASPDDAQLALSIEDPDGAPLEGVRVLLDGAPLGETSTGGGLTVGGLASGAHRVEIGAEGFQTIEQTDLDVTVGATAELALVLRRNPGAVRVRVIDALGQPVPDATVRWDGPARLASTAIGAAGERIFQLRPGDWSLLVVSPRFGLQQRELLVPEDRTDLLEVDVTLQPPEEGSSELTLRVIDPDGVPVDDARVVLDSRDYGATSTGGSLTVPDLLPGPRTLALEAPRMRALDDVPLDLVDGMQERVITMLWEPGTARFRVSTPDAPVDDGAVRLVGPAPASPLDLDSQGEAWATLEPGSWQAVAVSPSAGLQERDLEIPPQSTRLHKVDMVLIPEGGFANLVVRVSGPDGLPVDGTQVALDGTPVGATSAGMLSLASLDAGSRQLDIGGAPYELRALGVDLDAGDNTLDVELGWGVGAVRVTATGPDGPATDAVIRAAGVGALPPMPLTDDGSRLLALTPGTWQVLAVSERFGIEEQAVLVPETPGLTEVAFDLLPVAAGAVELLVRAVGEDGEPIEGAVVTVDGTKKGKTSAGGVLIVDGLGPGSAAVEILAPNRQTFAGRLDLDEGLDERMFELPWVPRPIEVRVQDGDGAPVDASVAFDGPADVEPGRTGADGVGTYTLRPGTWRVMASTASLGMKSLSVDVEAGSTPQVVELVLAGEAKVELTAGAVVIREQVPFDFDRATLGGTAGAILDEVANTLLAHPEVLRVEVQGHTDNVGGVAYNQDLSSRRAAAVVAALVERGVAPERLTAAGYGQTQPLTSNETPAGQATNRRVQFDIRETAAE